MKLTTFLLAGGLALTASVASAATLATFTNDYGFGAGKVNPGGTDVLKANSVTVSDQSTVRFSDSFDFSTLVYDTIDSFDLTLNFANAGPSYFFGFPLEEWRVRVQGNDQSAAATSDDLQAILRDSHSPFTLSMSAATDNSSINAFATALSTQKVEFWFSDRGIYSSQFSLASSTLTVNGTAPSPVPLPASALLLLAGLGGLGFMRKRKAA